MLLLCAVQKCIAHTPSGRLAPVQRFINIYSRFCKEIQTIFKPTIDAISVVIKNIRAKETGS